MQKREVSSGANSRHRTSGRPCRKFPFALTETHHAISMRLDAKSVE